MTFAELQTEVLQYIDEVDDTDVTLAVVKSALNQANRRRALEHDWSFMLAQPPVRSIWESGERSYTLPDDCRRVVRLYNVTLGWDYLEVPGPQIADSALPSSAGVSERKFYIRGEAPRQVVLFAPPGADTVELHYFKNPTAMVDDDDLPDLPEAHCDLLVWDALLRMKAYHNDSQGFPAFVEFQREAVENLYWTYGMGSHGIAGDPTYIRYVP
jgi:hypothetical protein